MTQAMDFEALRAEVLRIAAETGLPIHKITRKIFRQYSPLAKSTAERRHWGEVRSSFLKDSPQAVVPQGHHIAGVSTLVDANGETKIQWIKTAQGKVSREELLAQLIDRIKVEPLPPSAPVPEVEALTDVMAVYPLGDMHLGMYASALSSPEDWNLDRCVALARDAIDDLVQQGGRSATALLINLGDFFHTCGPSGTTVKGTPQDTDGTYEQCMEVGLSLKIYMVRRLLQHHSHVTVWGKLGNHDGIAALMVQIALREHFRDDPRVTIEVNSRALSFLRFGRNMIMSTHGDSRGAKKPSDLIATMAHDEKIMWGETDNRYAYLGHVHHKDVKEVTGGICEWFRTTSAPDAWHDGALYRAGRDMCRILLHISDGEIGRNICSVGRVRRKRGL